MKKIIVPVDFSDYSQSALEYALGFARKLKAQLLIVHIFGDDSVLPYVSDEKSKSDFLKSKKEAQEQLQKWTKDIIRSRKVPYTCVCRYGLIIEEELLLYIKKNSPLMVIMGTKGTSGRAGNFFGSKTSGVISGSKHPVLAIPMDAKFGALKRITFASEYNTGDFIVIRKLVEIAKQLRVQLNILHIADYDLKPEIEQYNTEKFLKKIVQKNQYKKISIELVYCKNPATRLKEYAMENPTDLLAVSTGKKGFFISLFTRSVAREMVHFAKTPVLIFQNKKQLITEF